MSHPQAFHTSCRNGLAAHPGFQFNAASASLDGSLLPRLASVHAGYHVPRDMPLEPGAEDLKRFPVALKVAPVDGVGAVVSRTRYVGREFRGRDGQPDEGRFGNYFSHIVVGNGGETFDGLLGIELWDAPHWTDRESDQPSIGEIDRLVPGPLDVARVARSLASISRDVRAAVLDAAVSALDGGPRVVLVEADNARAPAWIGWISYALPPAQAQRLTFTTFDGRPRYADDVHVCITTPACDIAFAQHELGNSVRLVDVGSDAPQERASLYARVALALAERGTEALAPAIRAVPANADGSRRGAYLAVAGGLTELVEDDELASVVDLLRELAMNRQVALAAETAKELPADASTDRATLAEWAALHRAARGLPADDDSRSLAATALARIIAFVGELPDDIPTVAHDTPTQPGVGNLAPWLSAVETAAGTPTSGALIRDGLRLGLVGVNAAVDRRLARVLSSGLAHAPVQAALRTIGAQPAFDHIVATATEALADRAPGDAVAHEHLRMIAAHRAALQTLRRRAEEERSFERMAMWLQAEVALDSSRRRSAAADLATLATSDRDDAEIRQLWGVDGPRGDLEHVELLTAYLTSGVEVPLVDVHRALDALMSQPFKAARATDPLGATLRRCDERVLGHPSYRAWWVMTTTPGPQYPFAKWAGHAAVAMKASARDLPEARWQELCTVVAEEVLRQRRASDYADAIAVLRSRAREDHDDWVAEILRESFRKDDQPARLAAELFQTWSRLRTDGADLVEDVLARAAQGLKRRDLDEAEEFLSPSLHEDWRAWQERHPRSSVARSLGLRGRRTKDAGAEA